MIELPKGKRAFAALFAQVYRIADDRAEIGGVRAFCRRIAELGIRQQCGIDLCDLRDGGAGAIDMDRIEAQAIQTALGDVPVTAPKSAFGHMGAGGGAVELAASVLGLERGLVPPTLNYEHPDPACPVTVVHGGPLAGRPSTAVAINLCSTGQAAAVVIAGHQEP